MQRILFVCHGNICRSPMAESVLADMLNKRGRSGQFIVRSAATSTEEIGNPVHCGTVRVLRQHGVPLIEHRAVQLKRGDYDRYDLIIGMDEANRRNILRLLGDDPEGKVCCLLDFSENPRDIADPWYTGDFDTTYADIAEGCTALIENGLGLK